MVRSKIVVASNSSAGNGTTKQCEGGEYRFSAEGTWGGGNIKLQQPSGNGTMADVASSTLSANGSLIVTLAPGQVRAVITTASAIYAELVPTK